MIYLGNGLYSESGPDVLAHGGPWKTHKYIAIKNGRYIYPGDVKGGNRDKYQSGVNSQGPSAAERAQSYAYNPYYKDPIYRPGTMGVSRKSKNVDQGESHESEFVKDWRLKGVDAILDRAKQKGQDLKGAVKGKVKESKDKKKYKDLYGTVKVTKPSSAQRAQSNSSGEDVSRNVSGMPKYGRPDSKKYQNSASSQGPSAAERAQRNRGATSSRSTSSGSKNVTYSNKEHKYAKNGPSAAELAQRGRTATVSNGKKTYESRNTGAGSNPYKKYNDSVSSQNASAAELAQRGRTATVSNGKKTYSSRNTGSGSKTKKKLFGR